jgi:hypothetical protein
MLGKLYDLIPAAGKFRHQAVIEAANQEEIPTGIPLDVSSALIAE